MKRAFALLFERSINSSIRQAGDVIQIRTLVREAPAIVVLSGSLVLLMIVGVSALQEGSSGGWFALAFTVVFAYPLIRRLGGGGVINVSNKGVKQRAHYSIRRADWIAIDGIAWDPSGRVVVHTLSGERAVFVTLGLPAVTWERNLYAWRDDPSLLDPDRMAKEVERLRAEARMFYSSNR